MDLLFLCRPRIEWRHITRSNGLFRGDGNLTGGSFVRGLFMFRMNHLLQGNPEADEA